MKRLWLLLLVLCFAPRAVFAGNVRAVKAGFSTSTSTEGMVGTHLGWRCFVLFEAPATIRVQSVTAPDDSSLEFEETSENNETGRMVRVRGVRPEWKTLRVTWSAGDEKTKETREVVLPESSSARETARIGKSAHAIARLYEETDDKGRRFAFAFASGAVVRPLQTWKIRAFTAFEGEPKDTWRNLTDSTLYDKGIFFRPDGSPRARDESFAALYDQGTQYRLEVVRCRQYQRHHMIEIPLPKRGETLEFKDDEWSDESVTVRSIFLDAAEGANGRGHVKLILEFLPVFQSGDIVVRNEKLRTSSGEVRYYLSTSPFWQNGTQKRGVFQMDGDVLVSPDGKVEVVFDHIETENPDLREEIIFR